MKTKIYFFLVLSVFALQSKAQYSRRGNGEIDKVAFGIGLGFDYGGIGGSILAYPQENIGLFVGGGYTPAGFGYNVGVKARFMTKSSSRTRPYLIGMYGYNAAIAVTNASQFSKLFYGPSFGFGIDRMSRHGKGYWSYAILFPVRGTDVDNYINTLRNSGVNFSNGLSPVAFSIGYHFIIE